MQKVPTGDPLPLRFFRQKFPGWADEQRDAERAVTHGWKDVDKDAAFESRRIATVNGKRLMVFTYKRAEEQSAAVKTVQVLLAERRPGLFAPFYVAMVGAKGDLLDYELISGKRTRLALIASCYWSGSGALQIHHVFSFATECPELIESIEGNRSESATPLLEKWRE